MTKLFYSGIAAMTLMTAMGHAQTGSDDFETMCRTISASDGLSAAQIDAFCPCLSNQAKEDAALEAELRTAVETESDPQTRMSQLSEAAKAAVASCQA
ncbi:hypothetical protein [Hyphomonas sp. KY3]|jgi:uncharacterized protein YsxB (DUF464 family)|uniref:hypothetical protein n=1 Tax=Hyphomonas sp. KY3 TaxID=2016196 RepID=UPI001A90C1F1|nr:hypothetical protein [Hyphomonas sp. KY3]QSR22051.1 hypothetical protein CFA77_07050 [Hyphomonas sp. KY3]